MQKLMAEPIDPAVHERLQVGFERAAPAIRKLGKSIYCAMGLDRYLDENISILIQ